MLDQYWQRLEIATALLQAARGRCLVAEATERVDGRLHQPALVQDPDDRSVPRRDR
jgi:hypothetical protein